MCGLVAAVARTVIACGGEELGPASAQEVITAGRFVGEECGRFGGDVLLGRLAGFVRYGDLDGMPAVLLERASDLRCFESGF